MNNVNFTQLVCQNVSEDGSDITGIFDVLVCQKGTTPFTIHIFCSQLGQPNKNSSFSLDKYYYRIVLRHLGHSKETTIHYRIDSGFLWDSLDKQKNGHSTRLSAFYPGSCGRLVLNYSFDFQDEGNYEIDLYTKKTDDSTDLKHFDDLPIRDLDISAVSPFRAVISRE